MRRWFTQHSQAVAAVLLAVFCGSVGVALLDPASVPGAALTRASYNSYFSTLQVHDSPPENCPVTIVYLDLESHLSRQRDPAQAWPRELYALLLRRLTDAGARAVVFDVVFDAAGTNLAANAALREAIAGHGRVVLAGELQVRSGDSGVGTWGRAVQPLPPLDEFREVAAGWGLGELAADQDFVVRKFYPGTGSTAEAVPSLTMAAARALQISPAPAARTARWLHYYGPPLSLPHRSLGQVLDAANAGDPLLRDKIVLVGARPITGLFQERRDEFRTPFHLWTGSGAKDVLMPGVEVHATQMLNLLRGDWLTRPGARAAAAWFFIAGAIFGGGLIWLRPVPSALLAMLGIGAVAGLAAVLFRQSHLWFPWLIVAGVQIPAAFVGTVLFHSVEWYLTRRRLQATKRAAEARIREQAALIEKAHDAILVRDLEGRITYINPSAERLFGWRMEELRESGGAKLFADPACAGAARMARERGEWNGELRLAARDGRSLILESRWTLLRDEHGAPKGLLVMSTDVTERKQLEAESLRMQRMEAIGSLAGGMAHDLNNALAPILMGAQLLRREARDDNARRVLSLMESSTRRGADMVRQVLLFARGRQGDAQRLDVRPLVKEMEKLARDTFPPTISVNAQTAGDLWPVRANATQLHQVLLNLCVNARDAMPRGGTLSLAADNVELDIAQASAIPGGRAGQFVVLMVSDTGTGIAAEVLPKIFEPFFTTKPEGQGTGLGLSTTARIVKAHEGFIAVQSEPGEGTTFEVYLPRFAERELLPDAAEAPAPPRGEGQTILVADDDEAVRELLRRSLEDHGYRVLTAANGAEAVAECKRTKDSLALLITDRSMPVLDGPQAIESIRQQLPGLPAILLSADEAAGGPGPASPENLQFLSKPVELEALLWAVARGLGRV